MTERIFSLLLFLLPGFSAGAQTAFINMRVTDEQNKPVPEAFVEVLQSGNTRISLVDSAGNAPGQRGSVLHAFVTDSTGNCTIALGKAGRYTVRVLKNGYAETYVTALQATAKKTGRVQPAVLRKTKKLTRKERKLQRDLLKEAERKLSG